MATTNAHSSVTAEVNDGGTVLGGGNIPAAAPMTKNIDINDINGPKDYPYGSQVVANATEAPFDFTDPDGVTTAKAGGAGGIAYFPDARLADDNGGRNFLFRHAGTTSAGRVNNSAQTVGLNSTGSEGNGRNFVGKEAFVADRRLGTGGSYNILALPSSGVHPSWVQHTANRGGANTYIDPAAGDGTSPATDAGVRPTRNVPGELTYRTGAKNPVQDAYKPRDTYES